MATPCVPTLGAVTFLKDVGQILQYQLRAYITLPKSRSDIYGNMITSYMDDLSNISYDKTIMAETVENSLMSMYNRIFKNSTVQVSVSCEAVALTGTNYNLEITVSAENDGVVYTMLPIVVNDNGIPVLKNDTVFREFV